MPELMKVHQLSPLRRYLGRRRHRLGGEAMPQQEFIADCSPPARRKGIHTCLDTNGFVRATTTSCSIGARTTPIWCCSTSNRSTTRSTFRLPTSATSIPGVRALSGVPRPDHVDPLRGGATWSDDDEGVPKGSASSSPSWGKCVEKVELLPYHELGKHRGRLGHLRSGRDRSPQQGDHGQ